MTLNCGPCIVHSVLKTITSGWWWPGLFVCQDLNPEMFTCGQATLNVKSHGTNPHTEDDG